MIYEINGKERPLEMDAMNREFQRLLVTSGWSQARAAQELRLDAATISRYMGNTITPSETVLRLFGEILGERVVLPGNVMPPTMRESARHLEPYEARAMEALRRLSPDHRRKFCELISMMAEVGQLQDQDPKPTSASGPVEATRPAVAKAARAKMEGALSAAAENILARRARPSEPGDEPNAGTTSSQQRSTRRTGRVS